MNMQFLLFFVVVCKCIVYQQIMTCCESHTTLFLYQVWCMSVLLVAFLSYTNMHIPIVLAVVHSKVIYKQSMGMLLCCTNFHACDFC